MEENLFYGQSGFSEAATQTHVIYKDYATKPVAEQTEQKERNFPLSILKIKGINFRLTMSKCGSKTFWM